MAHSVGTRGLAGGLMLLLCGTMSASTAGRTAAQATFPTLPLAVVMPPVVAFADPLTSSIEPAAAQADEVPIVDDDDKTAIVVRPAPARARPAQTSTAYAPARFFTINEVLAKRSFRADAMPSVRLAAIDPATTATDAPPAAEPKVGDEPFGLFTFRAPEGLLWTKWRKIQVDIGAEAAVLGECESEPDHCTPAAVRFNAIVAEAKAQHGRARFELVNERINAAIRYTSDMAQHGASDVWSAPLTSLTSGLGDCEDYAIAKYVALRNAGVADSDLHLLLVRDSAVRMDHAVLAARDEGRWLILDNRWTRVVEDGELRQFMPLFALDEQGVKLFAAPFAALGTQQDGNGATSSDADQDAILAEPTPAAEADAGALPWTAAPLLL